MSTNEGPTTGWAPIPNWIIRDSDLSLHEIVVLLALIGRVDRAGECYPSVNLLAKEARCSTRSVQRALDSLGARGMITREWRHDSARRGAATTTYYTTHLERPVAEGQRKPNGWVNGRPPGGAARKE